MQIPFRHGIIRYQHTGSIQTFLQITGSYVSFSATNAPTLVAFAHKNTDYLLVEGQSVNNAWGPFTGGVDYWLYWDINTRTGIRTFGATTLLPVQGAIAPTAPAEGQHWFDTTNKVMKVRVGAGWKEVIRVFACYYKNAATILPFASGLPSLSFAGSQVGLISIPSKPGRIFFDEAGKPTKKDSGQFVTSEDQLFMSGTRINGVRLESDVSLAVATESIPAFSVVALTGVTTVGEPEVSLADYEDTENTILAIATESVILGDTTNIVVQGVVTNPDWDWPTVGAPLWVDTNGELTDADPYLVNIILHPARRVPVARVFSADTIFFQQGMGGTGEQGPPGTGANIGDASTSNKGIVLLSTSPIIPTLPIAVGDNDPRMTNARAPTAHTHPATEVTITPFGNITGPDAQLGIQQLETNKLDKSGGTMTDFITLHSNPTANFHAATKNYVDTLISGLTWLPPIQDPDLVDDSLLSPPVTPDPDVVYLVNTPASGAWTGLEGRAVRWDGLAWVDILGRVVQIGDRFGVTMEFGFGSEGGNMVGKHNQIATITNATPGSYAYTFEIPTGTNAVLVNNALSVHFGHTYAYQTLSSSWVEVGGPTLVIAGDNLSYTGNTLNVVQGSGSNLDADLLDGLDSTAFVLKAGDTMTGLLVLSGDPVVNLGAATKQYVDNAAPVIPLNEIVFGTGTGISSSPTLTYDPAIGEFLLWPADSLTPGELILNAANAIVGADADGGSVEINTGSGDDSGNGGSLTISCGNGGNNGDGGFIEINAGDGGITNGSGGHVFISAGGSDTSGGGNVHITAGSGFVDGDGGALNLSAGTAGPNTGNGGSITLFAGVSFTGTAGSIVFNTNSTTRFSLTGTGEWDLAGDVGTVGEALVSNGPGTPPTWQSIGGLVSQPLNQIVFGTGTDISSDPSFTYDPILGAFNLLPIANTTPGEFHIATASADAGSDTDGGWLDIKAGTGDGTGTGGDIDFGSGNGGATGDGGSVNIYAGNGGGTSGSGGGILLSAGISPVTGFGGDITISAGSSADSAGGPVDISSGSSQDDVGGDITISAGSSLNDDGGNIYITSGNNITNGNGGEVQISGGAGGSISGDGGPVDIFGGDAITNGNGGNVGIDAGNGEGTGSAGNITLLTGSNNGTGEPGKIFLETKDGGHVIQSSGGFDISLDATSKTYILRHETTDNTTTELFLDGVGESQRMVLSDDSTWQFEIKIAARRTDVNGESAAYKYEGAIDRATGVATVALVGTVLETILAEDTPAWVVNVDADTTNGSLRIQVTGENLKTIRWVAFVRTVEIIG